MKVKKIYTVVVMILLIGLYIAIFRFSAQDAEESSNLSRKVTEIILQVYYRLIGSTRGGAGDSGAVEIWDYALENVIRKTAHFTEYMCMGFLSYSVVVLWYKPLWKGRILVFLQLLISAGLDELHQYFVPGRWASIKDVVIDTAGGAVGILLMIIFDKIRKKSKKKVKRNTMGKMERAQSNWSG
ncbi:VanZ family protein [Parablautia muri]|uniref:VanZ family protein n=1 Tax=Parablautia muri TaxID=2320879 RepID=A0A9X5BED5_9FIRM|nr:VanZ family protein [Parablautia muri]NBJ92180.1 VanZ family protein [Parablautia muri]